MHHVSLTREKVYALRGQGFDVLSSEPEGCYEVLRQGRCLTPIEINRQLHNILIQGERNLKAPNKRELRVLFEALSRHYQNLEEVLKNHMNAPLYKTYTSGLIENVANTTTIIKEVESIRKNPLYQKYSSKDDLLATEIQEFIKSKQGLIDFAHEYIIEPHDLRLAISNFINSPTNSELAQNVAYIIEMILKDPKTKSPLVDTQELTKVLTSSKYSREGIEQLKLSLQNVHKKLPQKTPIFEDPRRYKIEAIYKALPKIAAA